MEPGSAVSWTPWMLAAQPPRTQRWGTGGRNLSVRQMVAPSPSQTGVVFSERGSATPAAHDAAPGQHQVGVSGQRV